MQWTPILGHWLPVIWYSIAALAKAKLLPLAKFLTRLLVLFASCQITLTTDYPKFCVGIPVVRTDGVQSRDCLTHGARLHCSAIRTSRPNCSSLKSRVRFSQERLSVLMHCICTPISHRPSDIYFLTEFSGKNVTGSANFPPGCPFCQVNVLTLSTVHKCFMLGL